jgi:iron-sulfur cluster assembly accessory protein
MNRLTPSIERRRHKAYLNVTQSSSPIARFCAEGLFMSQPTSDAIDAAPVSMSASAARRLTKILNAEEGAALRISVKGGGCSGFQYAFDIEKTRADDDFIVERDGAVILVDPVSLEYMKGSEVDFVDDLMGQSFKVKNPNAVASCGCGVSFTV